MADGYGDPPASTQAPKFKLPKGCDSEEEFLRVMRSEFDSDWSAEFLNMQAGLEDAAFLAGLQWDTINAQRRAAGRKPILTFNRLPAFLGLVIGNRRMSETTIKVLPDNGGTKPVARLRQGLARSIEKNSNADRAYNDALQQAATSGIGNFRLVADYASYDAFTQDLKIEALNDFTAVVWDRLIVDPTGKDATRCFVQDRIPTKQFQNTYPWAQAGDLGGTMTLMTQLVATEWFTQDTVRVVSYWKMRHDMRTVALMQDGSVADVTDKPREEWLPNVAMHPVSGEPYVREAKRPYAEMYLCSACNILAGPYRMYTYRIPVFRVPGWEINIAGSKQRFGLIRFLKDPQRLLNYWRSIQAEKLMMAPKAKWVATKKSVAGLEEKWRNAHLSDDPLLLWNDEESATPPTMVPPIQMEPALIQESQQLSQDLRDISGLHEASLGMVSNEVSGKAINARQRVGEMGTVLYTDNLNMAIEECGRVIVDLIPRYYDTPRIVKVLGEEGKEDLAFINNPDDPESDITVGKYSVTVATGPSYATKRMEAVETLTSLVNSAPEAMAVGLDIIVDNMDLPGAEKLSKRLKAALPPQFQDPSDMTPEEQEAMAASQQAAQEAQAMEKAAMDAQVRESMAKAALAEAKAEEAAAKMQQSAESIEKTMAEVALLFEDIKTARVEREKIAAETREIDARTELAGAQVDKTDADTSSVRVNDVLAARQQEIDRENAEKDREVAAKAAKEKAKNATGRRPAPK